MKRIMLLTFLIILSYTSYCQTPIDASNEGFSNWLFIRSDNALQIRYKQIKQEGEVGYYSVQLRINFEDKIFCDDPICLGYYLVYEYPSLDGSNMIKKSFKFFNTYKSIYTLEEPIAIKLSFPDGSKRILRKEGWFYTVPDSNLENKLYLGLDCVVKILSNRPDSNRCKDDGYVEKEAIVIK
jgi:hypothetical protein